MIILLLLIIDDGAQILSKVKNSHDGTCLGELAEVFMMLILILLLLFFIC